MITDKIKEMLAEKVGCDIAEINDDTLFSDLGIDSLDITEMMMGLEDEYGISLEVDSSVVSVGALAGLIEKQLAK